MALMIESTAQKHWPYSKGDGVDPNIKYLSRINTFSVVSNQSSLTTHSLFEYEKIFSKIDAVFSISFIFDYLDCWHF